MPRGTNQLNRDGMSATERREAKMELVLQGRLQWWRKLMSEGKDSRAEHYATTYSLHELVAPELAAMQKFKTVIAENPEPVMPEIITLPETFYVTPAQAIEVAGKMLKATAELDAPQTSGTDYMNGWPVKCVASVERYPINPKMVIARLPDGREVRLWNDGARRWKLGAKVKVKIEEAGAEPIYVGDFDE